MLALLLSFLLSVLHILPSTPPDGGTYALTNARIVTVTKGIIEGGTLVIQKGKITAVGKNVPIPQDAQVIDCTGKSIYPGLFDGGSTLGLGEIGSVPETQDADELGNITPQMQALTAVNPNSVLIPVTRVNGVTTALSTPTGGLFSGTAALLNLHGYTPEQMYAGFKGIVLNFPTTGRFGGFDRRTDEEVAQAATKALETLNTTWQNALDYARIMQAYKAAAGTKVPEYVPEMDALRAAVQGEMPVLIEVNTAKDIEAALAWVKGKNIKAIFTGVAEGWRVADKLAAAKIPCIVGPIITLPTRESDRYDRAYANAGLLHKAGVKVVLRARADENTRNLPYHAGFAAAYGLGKDEALKAITINAAEVFGLADQRGSLEVGKNATLFVTDGDPFETKTNVHHLFIEGYKVSLETQQTNLYKEFLNRTPGLNK